MSTQTYQENSNGVCVFSIYDITEAIWGCFQEVAFYRIRHLNRLFNRYLLVEELAPTALIPVGFNNNAPETSNILCSLSYTLNFKTYVHIVDGHTFFSARV